MRNVRLVMAYHGARFHGWQRQDGFDSVQQALEEALLAATGEQVSVHGAGRTDTGVHALGQVASFHTATRLDDDRLLHAVNAHLPAGAVVRSLATCHDAFHARFHALSKRYAYTIACSRFRPALAADLVCWTPWPLDVGRMRRAAADVVGEHDFRAFGNAGSPRSTSVRRVQRLHWIVRRQRLTFVIQGDGFLYNMVRTIAGTLIDVGRRKRDEDALRRALASGERDDAGPTAPAEGLCLVSVQYGPAGSPPPPRRVARAGG
jgi:tRNA pseudouridine38-40 synthase